MEGSRPGVRRDDSGRRLVGPSPAPPTPSPSSIRLQPADSSTVQVRIRSLDAATMECLQRYASNGGRLEAVLRVIVLQAATVESDDLPDVQGDCRLLEDGMDFTPYFPFERGIAYRAIFDPLPLGERCSNGSESFEFSIPELTSVLRTEVTHVFPSSDRLPENLLRFHVCFSSPMQRGRVEAEIALFGPDGQPAADVLYRAPVELWDRSMRQLTVLLDPGRLKRGVGPNRALGPPLEAGLDYTLVVGAGMTDLAGRPLPGPFHKRFRVTAAVRQAIGVEQWRVRLPAADSREPLVLRFERPLDRALLVHGIEVRSTDRRRVAGQVSIDETEHRWSFVPSAAWAEGSYEIQVSPSLEDVCGNSVGAAFERPLRQGTEFVREPVGHAIAIRIARNAGGESCTASLQGVARRIRASPVTATHAFASLHSKE